MVAYIGTRSVLGRAGPVFIHPEDGGGHGQKIRPVHHRIATVRGSVALTLDIPTVHDEHGGHG